MRNVALSIVAVFALVAQSLGSGDEFRTSVKNTRLIVHYHDPLDEAAALDVLIYGTQPSSAQAERILRHNLDAALALYNGKDVLATAWHVKGDDERQIPLQDGSNSLIYVAKEKNTKTWKEHTGTRTDLSINKESGYFVEYEEHEILVPPKGRKFATLDVVFESDPPRDKAYGILVAQLKKAVAKQTTRRKTTAYASVGKREDPAGRSQVRDAQRRDAGYIVVEYDPANGKITGGDGNDLGRIEP